ncbi:hypothetical protein KGM_212304 [Danaus plexippus plexippus]|uniref:Uncharacterized protein n=1 Tax=Danaus plexippus plexippus TaxID=278856 RepID=A0A212ETY6_DANPL|nr:hypothetical protein KGM_212304 [Danaus plexippus plexippus]
MRKVNYFLGRGESRQSRHTLSSRRGARASSRIPGYDSDVLCVCCVIFGIRSVHGRCLLEEWKNFTMCV